MKGWNISARGYAISALLGVIIALALAAPVAGDEAELATFRSDLLTFAAELETVPGLEAGQAAGFAQAISALSPEQIAGLAQRAPQGADWRALPQVLRNLEQVRAARRARLQAKVAALEKPLAPAEELEAFRGELSFFVGNLRAFAPLARDGGLDARLSDIEHRIAEFPSDHLGQLRRMYYRNAGRWLYQLRGAASGGNPQSKDFELIPTIPGVDCDFGCPCDFDCDFDCSCTRVCVFGVCTRICDPICLAAEELCEVGEDACNLGCDTVEDLCEEIDDAIDEINSVINEINGFLNDVVSFFSDVVDEITALPDTLGDFFTELGNDLLSLMGDLLDELLELLPDADELLGLLGLDFANQSAAIEFFVDLVTEDGVVNMPCPSLGTDIPGYGIVGTPRAEYVCTRGIDWLSEKLYDLIPDDGVAAPVEIAAAVTYYPIKYYCMCMAAQSQLGFAADQATHRALVEEKLDAVLSTRASQTSADDLQATTDTLDAAVADLRDDTDDTDTDVVVVSTELTAVEAAIDDLTGSQEEQTAFVEAFSDLVRRMRIEENLLRQSSEDAVALFQSPEAFAGFLEVAREIVADTIQMNLDAGQEVFDAPTFLRLGDALLLEGVFEKAYAEYRRAYREAVRE